MFILFTSLIKIIVGQMSLGTNHVLGDRYVGEQCWWEATSVGFNIL